MTPADEILAVLAEHLECRCDKPCVCGADSRAVHTMADEIVALRAERDALRALAVQPWKHIEPRDSFEIEWTILP